MTSRTTSKFSSEVRAHAVRMMLYHEAEHISRWQASLSIATRIGCTGQTLNGWLKKVERGIGRKPGLTTNMAARLKALECENRELTRRPRRCLLAHVNRQFKAPRPNALSVTGFTYVATWTGFVYVAFIIDAYARRMRASYPMRWSRPCTTGGRCTAAALCSTATVGANLASTGRRKATLGCVQRFVESLGRRSPFECFARPAFEGRGNGGDIISAVDAEVRPLREVLPQQPIGVLVRPPLPQAVGIAELHLQPRLAPQPGMLRHLRSFVPGQ